MPLQRSAEEAGLDKCNGRDITLDSGGHVRIKYIWNETPKLSNMHSCKVVLDGEEFESVECAFQTAKRRHFLKTVEGFEGSGIQMKKLNNKSSLVSAIRKESGCSRSKAVVIYEDALSSWKEKTRDIMEQLLMSKFELNHDLRNLLIATGNWKIYEAKFRGGSVWERQSETDFGLLGELLMLVRDRMRGCASDWEIKTANVLRYK